MGELDDAVVASQADRLVHVAEAELLGLLAFQLTHDGSRRMQRGRDTTLTGAVHDPVTLSDRGRVADGIDACVRHRAQRLVGDDAAALQCDAERVEAAFAGRAIFAVQREQRGTGHAVLQAEAALRGFDGSVLLLNGDLPFLRAETIRRVIDRHRSTGSALTLLTATVADPSGWGRIVRDHGAVRGIVEDRDAMPSQRAVREVNVGLYCARVPLLFAAISYWLIGFTMACLLGFRTGLGAVGVWIGLSVGTAIYALLLTLRFRLLASRLAA